MWNTVRALSIGVALFALPGAAFAQSAPSMTVERTPNYTFVLDVGPVDASMMSEHMDQGMAANHHVGVRIMHGDSDMVVSDVTPIIRITDKLTGESRDLPQVMGMADSMMHPTDVSYGQDVFLPDGTYLVTVMVGPDDTAMFRDVAVMAEHDMMMMDDH